MFYYLQLFLDDTKIKNFTCCYKEKKFLHFFVSRIRPNDLHPSRYPDFPYLSPCGRERNFIRCDDRPIVYTELCPSQNQLFYNGAGVLLAVEFHPQLLSMKPETGRVYYPAPNDQLGLGLVKSSLAIEFSKYFQYENEDESRPPKWITWKGQRILLQSQ